MSNDDLFPWKKGDKPIPGYVLDEFRGRGGYGQVWSATAPGNLPVAVKFFSSARELASLRMLVNVRHPHLLGLHSVHVVSNQNMLVMDLAECTLLDRLRDCMRQGLGGIPYPELINYFHDASQALDFLNQPIHLLGEGERAAIVHGDVKPGNFLIISRCVKVADFGLLRRLDDSVESHPTNRMTVAYAAPELLDRKISQFTDQYALAVSWCQLRGGRLPFVGSDAQVMAGHYSREPDLSMLPQQERPVVRKALSKDPRQRWPNCQSFVEALAAKSPGPASHGTAGDGVGDQPVRVDTLPDADSPRPQQLDPVAVDPTLRHRDRRPGEIWTNSLGMGFAWIPPGSFLMGSPKTEEGRNDEETPHRVTLTKGYLMAVTLVTQEHWEQVMGKDANHSHFTGDASELPVDSVSWDDCQLFCLKLSAMDVGRYTLPTEAEREYACRAGSTTPFWWGESITTDRANFNGERPYGKEGRRGKYRMRTTPVKRFAANQWGLYDMHGNLWQWCEDWDFSYPDNAVTDYVSPDKHWSRRVLRGGSWLHDARSCRAASRNRSEPDNRSDVFGCRVVCRLD